MKYLIWIVLISALIYQHHEIRRQQREIWHETWRVERLIDAIAEYEADEDTEPKRIPACAVPSKIPSATYVAGQVPDLQEW